MNFLSIYDGEFKSLRLVTIAFGDDEGMNELHYLKGQCSQWVTGCQCSSSRINQEVTLSTWSPLEQSAYQHINFK